MGEVAGLYCDGCSWGDEHVLVGRWDGVGGQHGQKETAKVKGRAGEMGW